MANTRSTIMRRRSPQTLQSGQTDNLSEEILSTTDLVVFHKLSFISRFSLIHEILLSTYYVSSIVLGVGETVVNKRDKNPCPLGLWLFPSSHTGVCADVSGAELQAAELGGAGWAWQRHLDINSLDIRGLLTCSHICKLNQL